MSDPAMAAAAAAAATACPRLPSGLPPAGDKNAAARQFAQTVPRQKLLRRAREDQRITHFAYPAENPLIWVKDGELWRRAEADTQVLAWEWVMGEREAGRCNPAIHVPEVFAAFAEDGVFFILMELVPGTVLAKSVFACPAGSLHPIQQCYDLVAEAFQLLRRMPVPPDAALGPYTPDQALRRIRHPLFNDYRAPVVYRNVDELELHINRVIAGNSKKPPPRAVRLERDLVFTYSDLHDENFILAADPATTGGLRLTVIDFEHAGFLPPSLLSAALLRYGAGWTAKAVAERVADTLPRANVEALGRASSRFVVSGGLAGLVRNPGERAWSLAP